MNLTSVLPINIIFENLKRTTSTSLEIEGLQGDVLSINFQPQTAYIEHILTLLCAAYLFSFQLWEYLQLQHSFPENSTSSNPINHFK